MFMKHEESLMWEIKINNKGIKMLYIYMNLGFVFSVFFFFNQKQMVSILQVLETILWNSWNVCRCSESGDDFINYLGCKRE